MPNAKNQAQLKELAAKVETAQAIYLADYSGLNLKAQRELRKKVKEAGGELIVAKNTLLKLVLKNKNVDVTALEEALKNQNITLFAPSDVVSPLKALVEFSKGTETNQPKLKAGVLGTEILSLEKVKQLASLPSKNELIAKLLGTLNNPARGLVSVLSATSRNLVYVLSAIKDKKSTSN